MTVDKRVYGAAVDVQVKCFSCGAEYSKCSSEKKNRQSLLNFLLSCAILFSGSLPTKSLRLVPFTF